MKISELKKVICIAQNDAWYNTKKFLWWKYDVVVKGPEHGHILTVSKEDIANYWFHEWEDESYPKGAFVELTEEQVKQIEFNRIAEFLVVDKRSVATSADSSNSPDQQTPNP